MRTRRTFRLRTLGVAAAAAALLLTACGGDSDTSGTGSTASPKGAITVGSANFGESEILAEIFAGALAKDGWTVSKKLNIGNREVYLKAMENGEIGVVPEYIGTLTEEFNKAVNGPAAAAEKPLASGDAAATFQALTGLANGKGFEVAAFSPAADQNAFAVTKTFAQANGLTKVSDLAKLNGTLVLGGPPECDVRPFCLPGLQKTYGLSFKELKKLDAGGPKTMGALKDGSIQVGLVFSSDGAVVANDLQVLEDDKALQTADNITALIRQDRAAAKAPLEAVLAKLTTEQLTDLNKRFSVDKEDAATLASDWLKANGLG